MVMDSTSLEISSDLVFSIPSYQAKEHQAVECGFESETDANSSSSSSDDDDNESMADSDSFFNIEALNQEEDEQQGYSYTTGRDGGVMKDIDEVDTATYRGATKKEKKTAEDKNGDVKDEISERVRKREEDKAFWEACLASGY